MSVLIFCLVGLFNSALALEGGDFKVSAEFRTRYDNDSASSFSKMASDANHAEFRQRNRINLAGRRGEEFSGKLSLVHSTLWGSQSGQGGGGVPVVFPRREGTFNSAVGDNLVLVNESWGLCRISEDVSVKFGRLGMTLDKGSVWSVNDWSAIPNTFDGVNLAWDQDFANFSSFALKSWEQGTGTSGGTTSCDGSVDCEAVIYGIAFKLKGMPDLLRDVYLHLIKLGADKINPTLGNIDFLRAGGVFGGEIGALGYRLFAAVNSGTSKTTSAESKWNGYMGDVEVNFSFSEFMKTKILFNYHLDSGDSDGNFSSGDGSWETYDPLFYDQHEYAGLMDVVSWGNLTYLNTGFSVSPMDDFTLSANYYLFTRTKVQTGAFVSICVDTSTVQGLTLPCSTAANDRSGIGSEINLKGTKSYGENLTITGLYGIFSPGEYLKSVDTAYTDTFSKLQLNANLTF